MSSEHDQMDSLKRELSALKETGSIDDRTLAAAMRYVASNELTVLDMLGYSGIDEVADSVIDMVRGCSSGRCE
jgi:hypothetical protein